VPLGRLVEESASLDELPPATIVKAFEFVAWRESMTVSVKLNVPPLVGVPVMAPAGDTFRPGGSCPAAVHRYGGVPPVALNAWL
jgi:hypothetical protein